MKERETLLEGGSFGNAEAPDGMPPLGFVFFISLTFAVVLELNCGPARLVTQRRLDGRDDGAIARRRHERRRPCGWLDGGGWCLGHGLRCSGAG